MTDISALEAYAGQLSEAAAMANASSEKQHQYVHGDDETDVVTESGPVPSLAKQARRALEIVLAQGAMTVASVVGLVAAPRSAAVTVVLRCYHPGINNGGGGLLHYDPTMPRAAHNGGTIFSPTVPWNGTLATHANYLLGVGETQPGGTGCFVRANQYRWPIQMFGAVADWNGTTGFDNRYAIEACIKAVENVHIPKGDYGVAAAGSIFIQGYDDKLISGAGALHKMGSKGIFSFNTCNNIRIRDIVMDGQIVADEAANGSIWGNGRAAANYAFAVSFASCHRSSVMNSRIYDFAWDGLVAQGAVAVGGESAVLSTEIKFLHNNIRSVRGTQIWIKAIYGGEITSNKLWNPTAFAQKANGIFVVEWNSEIVVAHNRMSWIGDNAIGLGQMQNRVAVARNRQINVHDNHIKATRYHAILIAPGEDVNVHHNTIFEAGAKSLMPGETSAVLTAAITVLGGEIDPINARIRVTNNIIRYPYEYGIYAYDRVGTPVGSGSSSIVIEGNTIFGAGRADFAERIDSGGIRTQLVVAPRISANDIDWIVGDGIRVFGDAKIDGNAISRVVGIGINVPVDTIWGNLSLSSAIVNNTVVSCTRAGIIVAGRKQASLMGNTCEGCGIDVAPAIQNITTAGSYAGIMTFNVDRVSMSGNILRNNGGPGFVGRTCLYIKDTGSVFSGNAKVLRDTQNLQSGAYIEGASGSLTKVTFITSGGDGGTTQYYPIRVLFGNANSVSLDGDFINHTSVPIGITPRSLINIAA